MANLLYEVFLKFRKTKLLPAEMSNPVASYAMLGVLTDMLDLEIDLSDISKEAVQMAEARKSLSQEVMDKYIDHFTEPIWERNPGDENQAA